MQAGMSFFPDKSGDGTSFRPESGSGRKSSAYRSLESFRIGNSIRAETVTRERTGFVLRVTGGECRDPKRFFRQQKPRPDRPKLKASIGNRPMGDQQKVPKRRFRLRFRQPDRHRSPFRRIFHQRLQNSGYPAEMIFMQMSEKKFLSAFPPALRAGSAVLPPELRRLSGNGRRRFPEEASKR